MVMVWFGVGGGAAVIVIVAAMTLFTATQFPTLPSIPSLAIIRSSGHDDVGVRLPTRDRE